MPWSVVAHLRWMCGCMCSLEGRGNTKQNNNLTKPNQNQNTNRPEKMLTFPCCVSSYSSSLRTNTFWTPRMGTRAKSKRRASCGKDFYQGIGSSDKADLAALERLRECGDELSRTTTRQLNWDEPTLWIRMVFSYIILVLHRHICFGECARKLTDALLFWL